MGFAKYREDNVEIMIERQIIRERKCEERGAYGTRILIKTSVPASEVYEKHVSEQASMMTVDKEPKYADKILFCKCCGQSFLFSGSAQKEYARRGWCAPKRCKTCRSFNNAARLMRQSF